MIVRTGASYDAQPGPAPTADAQAPSKQKAESSGYATVAEMVDRIFPFVDTGGLGVAAGGDGPAAARAKRE